MFNYGFPVNLPPIGKYKISLIEPDDVDNYTFKIHGYV